MSRIVSFVVLLAIVIVVGTLAFRVMSSFLLPMFLALVLAVIFRPLHKWFISRSAGHDRIAAGMTTTAILLIVLIPTLLIITRAAAEAISLATELDPEIVRLRIGGLRQKFHLEMPAPDVQQTVAEMQSTIDEIEAGLEQHLTFDFLAQSARHLQELVATIHEQLRLGLPPADNDVFMKTLKESSLARIQATWQTLDNQTTKLVEARPGSEEYNAAATDAEKALRAFRQSLFGTRIGEWLLHQANPDEQQIAALRDQVLQLLGPLALGTSQKVGGILGSFLVGLGVMIISLYYFLADGPSMIRALMHLSPLDDRYEEALLNEFSTVSRAVVLATLLSAFAQGLLASIGYFFAGFESVFLLTVVTMVLAMIPFVGAAAVWGACSVWLFFYEDRLTAALALAAYGTLVVSMIDNLIKPMVLHGQSRLHPLLALLSILGGIKLLGPIGIFVGPMGMAFLQALLNMLHTELMALDSAAPQPTISQAPPAS